MKIDKDNLQAKAMYDKLSIDREVYLRRAEDCARVTIPRIFPKEGEDSTTTFTTPYNSVGARGLNNLASKLLLALLPPNQPFFRLGLDQNTEMKLKAMGDDQVKDSIEYGLSILENSMMKYMEAQSLRPTLAEALRQLIVAGNALLFLPPKEGGIKCYSLRDYVVQRDGTGNVLQIVAKDSLSKGSLPDNILELLEETNSGDYATDVSSKVEVYTHVYLDGNVWRSYQEVNGKKIPESEQQYPKDKTPWIPVRYTKQDGESYGRSFVEDYLGDLITLEKLSQSINDLSVISAKILFLVSPSCQTSIRALEKAHNGQFVVGRQEDIIPMQINKAGDLQVTMTTSQNIEQRLSFAFLLNSAVQRSGERVTAEEIRYVAGELEDTLGGTYSLLSNELQLPLVRCVFNQMQSNGSLPEIPEFGGSIEPTIITGVDALGRGHDLANLTQALNLLVNFPEVMQTIKQDNLALRVFTAAHIDTTGLVKTPEEIQADREAAMQQYQQQVATDAAGQAAVAQARNQ